MKLEEAFEKYPDTQKMCRSSTPSWCKNTLSCEIGWLKGLHVWCNEESKALGFIIPQFMIEDDKADDWEPVDEN